MQTIIRATDLLKIVDGTFSCPSNTIRSISGTEIMNPEAIRWKMIDAHLLSYITATLSPSIFTFVLHLRTSSQVWHMLDKRFTSLSRSHIHQLKIKLRSISKKSNSREIYLSKIKSLVDQLSIASSFVDDEDIVLLILNGLLMIMMLLKLLFVLIQRLSLWNSFLLYSAQRLFVLKAN